MAIDETLPTDNTTTLAEYAELLRASRAAINVISAGLSLLNGVVSFQTDLAISSADTSLDIDDDLSEDAIELVYVTASDVTSLSSITGGRAGQIKIFVFANGNTTFVHNASYIWLKGQANYNPLTNHVLALMNIGGAPESSVEGTWIELFRNDNITATRAEINQLHSSGVSTSDLIKLHEIVSSSATINAWFTILGLSGVNQADLTKLHAISASYDELNIMDGVTANKDELNILDGVTASKDEINTLAGATSVPAANKAGIRDTNGRMKLGGVKIGSFNLSGESGQSITGVGFKPSCVIFLCTEEVPTNVYLWSVGFDDSTARRVAGMGYDGLIMSVVGSIYMNEDYNSAVFANISTLDSDGFTLLIQRDGTPGNPTVFYLALP